MVVEQIKEEFRELISIREFKLIVIVELHRSYLRRTKDRRG